MLAPFREAGGAGALLPGSASQKPRDSGDLAQRRSKDAPGLPTIFGKSAGR